MIEELVALAGTVLELAGVAVIVIGTAGVAAVSGVAVARGRAWRDTYRDLRMGVGRAILLGLELLVGADIIRTVAQIPSIDQVLVLGGIVLIRTFLSFTIEVELEGAWPWRRRTSAPSAPE